MSAVKGAAPLFVLRVKLLMKFTRTLVAVCVFHVGFYRTRLVGSNAGECLSQIRVSMGEREMKMKSNESMSRGKAKRATRYGTCETGY